MWTETGCAPFEFYNHDSQDDVLPSLSSERVEGKEGNSDKILTILFILFIDLLHPTVDLRSVYLSTNLQLSISYIIHKLTVIINKIKVLYVLYE